ncbi:MAG TPA: 8-oxo-dGTP diphosphatase MutT, partial [Polyangiaceae bacterium]
ELAEELGIEVVAGEILEVTFHRYEGRAVLLLFFAARRTPTSADPTAIDVADFRWASADELDPAAFPPADVAILEKVRASISGHLTASSDTD